VLFFKSNAVGECYLIEKEKDVALVKRLSLNDYVVVLGLNLKDGTWRSGFYYGSGSDALSGAIKQYKELIA
jgi:hypothetical protein